MNAPGHFRAAHTSTRRRAHTFTAPSAIAAASAIGLVAALTGDGWHDTLSWAGLAAPVLATGWAMRTRRN